jgi:hypothetical protein
VFEGRFADAEQAAAPSEVQEDTAVSEATSSLPVLQAFVWGVIGSVSEIEAAFACTVARGTSITQPLSVQSDSVGAPAAG